MRIKFDEQLELLNVEMIKMGALCEEAISVAIKGLLENDKSLPEKVSVLEDAIDQKGRDIESLCMKMLLQQQPVAGDLRQISSALKMISDMERIGDQANDIAEISRHIMNEAPQRDTHIKEMATEAIKMVTDSIDSFVKKDVNLAYYVIKQDDVVDGYFDEVKRELIGLFASGNKDGEYYIDVLLIAKYLERVGDHATNIAEWVVYSVSGKRCGGAKEL